MSSKNLIQLVIIIIGIMLSAFFSSSETAITSTSIFKIRQLEKKKIKNSNILRKLVDDIQTLITTILVGNNIVNILTTTIATLFFTDLFGAKGAIISTITMTLLVLIFGEITPKTIAQSKNEKISLLVSKPIYFLTKLLKPLVFVLSFITSAIIKLFIGTNDEEKKVTQEDIKAIVGVSEEQGVINNEESEIINNVFDFGDSDVADIMTPRTNMEAISADITKEELDEFLINTNHSRIPVFGDNIDNIIGILHVKDVINQFLKNKEFKIRDIIRPTYYAYEYMPIIDLFKNMQAKNISLAIVIDEYGGTSGIVAIEDIVEELVGEIDDEYDINNDLIYKISDSVYSVDPTLHIEEVNDYFDLKLKELKSDSIGGFVIDNLDRLPKSGDKIIVNNIEFIIEKVERYRIITLKMHFLNQSS
ncbi:MAG: hemolysin family protein [Tissierellia bacterium]|nr:hemolysin family protein [Tissierellia bacterium]